MSRIGKKGVIIPNGVSVTRDGFLFSVKGPLGELHREFSGPIEIKIDGQTVSFSPNNNSKEARALWGTYAAHFANMVSGVVKPFEKKLQIEGVGYKVEQQGPKLVFSLGFSHKVFMETPGDVKVVVQKNTITLSSPSKESVGMFAAQIRANKKPEPYKGKGIRYVGETVRRKQGKKSA